MAESIGSVSVDVIPNAEGFWTRFKEQTRAGAAGAGRDAGKGIKAGIESELRGGVKVRVNADTSAARAELTSLQAQAGRNVRVKVDTKDAQQQMHLLRDAVLLLGPATIPVAGVLTGAIAGIIPVAAAAVLGVKGISEEFKAGALDGTKYGASIQSLSDEFGTLKQTAAAGLLGGVSDAIQSSAPLFAGLNQDIGELSAQLGSIVSGAAPAFLTILQSLEPLFVTFGQLLSDGATKLENWAASSDGVQSFVAYVQAELPTVVHALGDLAETAGHLLQAFAPAGNAILTILGGFASAINSIPVGVLQGLVPVAISLYAAFRAYGAITAIVNGVSTAITAMSAPFVTTAAQAEASSLAIQAAAAQEAAAVAESNAIMAASAAETAVEIAAAVEATSSVLAAGAVAAAEAAIEESAAFQATAAAAIASAEEISAAAVAAAETVAAEGKVASAGWAGMLGPIGAVAVGVGILAATFLTSKKSAQDAAQAADSYAQSVKSSTDAMNLSNIQQTNANLAKKGALDLFSQLSAANHNLGVSQIDLTTAVNGTQEQFDSLTQALVRGSLGSAKQEIAAGKLVDILKTQRKGLQEQILTQTQLNSINAAAAGISDSQATTAAKLYGLTGTDGVAAYLAAMDAQKKSTDSTRQQTIAYQLEDDAGSLLQQTLDKLAGKQLSYAQAQNQFQQQLVTMAQNLKDGGKQLTGLSSDAITNRGALLQLVQGAEQTADAYGNMKQSSAAGRKELGKLRQQIIDNAVAHGEDRKAVTDYIDSVLKIPKKVPPTKLDIDTKQAAADLAAFKRLAEQRYQINVRAVNAGGYANVGKGVKAKAAGGTVGGSGGPTADNQLTWLSPGEEVINAKQADKHRALLKAINAGVQGFASGGTVGGDIVTLSGSGSGSSSGSSGGSKSTKVKVTVDASDLTSFLRALPTFVSTAATAVSDQFHDLITKVSQAGGGKSLVSRLHKENKDLVGLVRDRERTETRLSAAQDKLAKITDQYNQARTDTRNTILGTFNISTAGQAADQTIRNGFASGVSGVSTFTTTTKAGSISASSILDELKGKVADARKFQSDIGALEKRGLSNAFLQQFIDAGPDALPQLEALMHASAGQLSSLNANEKQLGSIGSALGKNVADRFYGAGVDAAQGLVNGLKSKDKALTDALDSLADRMVAQIRKRLKIHSPSQVFHELGAYTGQGLVNGMVSQLPAVRNAAALMANHAVPNSQAARWGGTTGTGGPLVQQNIHAAPGQSPFEIGSIAANQAVFALRSR